MSSFKRSQQKHVKQVYRVRNWRQYEHGLSDRGCLTVWISLAQGELDDWDVPKRQKRKSGRQPKYSDHAIETEVTLGMVFGLAPRQTEGFLRSLLSLLKFHNEVPDDTTISRRKAMLGKVAFYENRGSTPIHILIDSSGVSVHVGQLRKAPKTRDYRKLHLCVDERIGEVAAGRRDV